MWEIAAFGQCPLVGMQADEIIKMAEKGCLVHKMYVTTTQYYRILKHIVCVYVAHFSPTDQQSAATTSTQ